MNASERALRDLLGAVEQVMVMQKFEKLKDHCYERGYNSTLDSVKRKLTAAYEQAKRVVTEDGHG